jgi:hypothetical protein
VAAHGGLGRRVATTEAASQLALRCLALLWERLTLLVLLDRVLTLRRVLLATVLRVRLTGLTGVLLLPGLTGLTRLLRLAGLLGLLAWLAVLGELLLWRTVAGRLT